MMKPKPAYAPPSLIVPALIAAAAFVPAWTQQQTASEGMIVRRVEIRGLATINEGFIRRTIKTRESQPLSLNQVQEDVRALLQTRKFLDAFAETRVEDGQAVVTFTVQEKPEVVSITFEGNKRFSEADLSEELTFASGEPLDLYAVNKGRDDILRKYHEAGYYYATVELDQRALRDENRVIYRITEGPRVKVRRIEFEGNRSFSDRRLRGHVETKTYIWIFRTGEFDEERAERDAVNLQQFYRDQGFLDARAGYRLEYEDVERTRLRLVFVIEEGPRYAINQVLLEGNTVFDSDRLRSLAELNPGDFLLQERIDAARRRIQDAYGEIGYVDARIDVSTAFLEQAGVADLKFTLGEGEASKFGLITIRGNQRTQDRVIRRELRFYPGEPYNTVAARKAEQRLMETGLFSRATITPLEDAEGDREALVEVEESDHVSFLVGAGVSSDAGVIGTISIENRNFDLFDWPRTWGEFFRGQSFRGAGQKLRLSLEPGSEVSRFRIDFEEPYLLERPLNLGTSFYLFQRERGSYDEERLGTVVSLGHRFESGFLANWAVEGAVRVEGIDIDDVNALAARDIREARGNSTLTSAKLSIVRDTTDSRLIPSEGYRATFSWEQAGVLGGDYDFGKPAGSVSWYKTLRTDVLDRKTILALRADSGFIVGDAPVFERFYAGGFGTLRGFDYRGVSPRAGIYDNAVGGDFILLTGAEVSFPIYGRNIRGVTFLDMGTVEEDFEITSWRASVGFGLRVQIDFFGPIPFVFDFGFPIAEEDDDETRIFTFSVGASF